MNGSKNKAYLILAIIIPFFNKLPVEANAAEEGVVSYTNGYCDYYVINWGIENSVVERRTGHGPRVGEAVVGDQSSRGFQTFYFGSSESSVYVEDYWLTEGDAQKMVDEKCR